MIINCYSTDLRRRTRGGHVRGLERLATDIPARLGALGNATGALRDLTENGFRLVSRTSYPVGTRFTLSLRVPGRAPELRFVAEVRWLDFAGLGDTYLMGCLFLHGEATRVKLRDLLMDVAAGNIPEVVRRPTVRRTVTA